MQTLRGTGICGFQISRQPAHECGKVISPNHLPLSLPWNYSWYSFLLEVESTPESLTCLNDYVNEKFKSHHRESKLQRSVS
jgi:hypothetical protein